MKKVFSLLLLALLIVNFSFAIADDKGQKPKSSTIYAAGNLDKNICYCPETYGDCVCAYDNSKNTK